MDAHSLTDGFVTDLKFSLIYEKHQKSVSLELKKAEQGLNC